MPSEKLRVHIDVWVIENTSQDDSRVPDNVPEFLKKKKKKVPEFLKSCWIHVKTCVECFCKSSWGAENVPWVLIKFLLLKRFTSFQEDSRAPNDVPELLEKKS